MRSSPTLFRKYVFRRLNVEKVLSTVAVDTGNTAKIFRRVAMLGNLLLSHIAKAPIAVFGFSFSNSHLRCQRHHSPSREGLEGRLYKRGCFFQYAYKLHCTFLVKYT